MRLIAYIRVSTDDQRKHGVSLAQQIDRCRAYCALHGHELADVICDEGVSGSVALAKRAGGAELLRKLVKSEADGVLVNRLDRLFRNALDGLQFFRDVVERGSACVHSISELIDTSTPAGKLMLTITLGFAQYDRDMDVARGRETNQSLREQGKVYGGVPFGCTSAPSPVAAAAGKPRRLLRRDPAAWAQRCYIVGLLRDGMSFSDLQARLVKERVRAPEGGKHWPKSTLRNLLLTHDQLSRLPFSQCADDGASAEEAEVSHVA